MDCLSFEKLLADRLLKTKAVLANKAREYADNDDKLVNMRLAAAILRTSVAKVCLGNMAKHLASIVRMCDDPLAWSTDIWDEKLGDAINYLILLEACVVDARNHSVGQGAVDAAVEAMTGEQLTAKEFLQPLNRCNAGCDGGYLLPNGETTQDALEAVQAAARLDAEAQPLATPEQLAAANGVPVEDNGFPATLAWAFEASGYRTVTCRARYLGNSVVGFCERFLTPEHGTLVPGIEKLVVGVGVTVEGGGLRWPARVTEVLDAVVGFRSTGPAVATDPKEAVHDA